MVKIFFISSGICLICFILRTVFNILKYRKSRWADNKNIYRIIMILMFILWFSWAQTVFSDPLRINIPAWLRYTGLLFFIIGVSLFILSHMKLKGFDDKGHMVTGGIYSKVRNPMYLGFILWVIGFPIFMQALAALASAVIWSAFFIFWKILEEKELEEKYEEYREYKKRTWF